MSIRAAVVGVAQSGGTCNRKLRLKVGASRAK